MILTVFTLFVFFYQGVSQLKYGWGLVTLEIKMIQVQGMQNITPSDSAVWTYSKPRVRSIKLVHFPPHVGLGTFRFLKL